MSTYVLVHGGAHGGWCYRPVAGAAPRRGARGVGADAHQASASAHGCGRLTSTRDARRRRGERALLRGPARRHARGPRLRRRRDRRRDRPRHRPGRPLVCLDTLVPVNGEWRSRLHGARRHDPSDEPVIEGVEVVLDPDTGGDAAFGVDNPDVPPGCARASHRTRGDASSRRWCCATRRSCARCPTRRSWRRPRSSTSIRNGSRALARRTDSGTSRPATTSC